MLSVAADRMDCSESAVRDWIRKWLASAGYVVFNTRAAGCYARDSLFTANNHRFEDDPVFKAAYARGVKASAGADPHMEWRVHVALWAAGAAARVPGDFVECGVNAGFVSSAIIQRSDSFAILAGRDRWGPRPRGGGSQRQRRLRDGPGGRARKLCRVAERRDRAGRGARRVAVAGRRPGGVPAHRHELRLPGTRRVGI